MKIIYSYMDIIKHLSEEAYRDIIISFPKLKNWSEYITHFSELNSKEGILRIIVREVPKTKNGNKCYIIFDGFLRGWMPISRLTETSEGEICVELLPVFNKSVQNAPMAEIDGFKYYLDNFGMQ